MQSAIRNFEYIWRTATTTRKIGIVVLAGVITVVILMAWANLLVGVDPDVQQDVFIMLIAPTAIGGMLCRLGGSAV